MKAGRSARGGAIVESAMGLILMVVLTVPFTALIVNAGTFMYYRQKTEFAGAQVVDFAASLLSWQNGRRQGYDIVVVRKESEKRLNMILRTMGLPEAAEFALDETNNGSIARLSFKVVDVALPFNMFISKVSLGETMSADLSANEPPALLQLRSPALGANGLLIPCYPKGVKFRRFARNPKSEYVWHYGGYKEKTYQSPPDLAPVASDDVVDDDLASVPAGGDPAGESSAPPSVADPAAPSGIGSPTLSFDPDEEPQPYSQNDDGPTESGDNLGPGGDESEAGEPWFNDAMVSGS